MTTKSQEAVDHESTPDDAATPKTGSTAVNRSSHAQANQAVPADGTAEDTHISRTTDIQESPTVSSDQPSGDRIPADNTDEATELLPQTPRSSGSEKKPAEPTRPLYRDEVDDSTQVISRPADSGEHTQLLAEVEAEETDWAEQRRAREAALGMKQRPPAYQEEEPQPVAPAKRSKSPRTTDRFLGSLGLFVLRVIVAGIMGLHGVAKLFDLAGVETMLSNTVIPYPDIMALVLAISEVAIAVALLLGVLVRLAGLGVAAIGIGALVFVLWLTFPFQNGYELTGELELLLGAVGILFLCVGGGRWSIDGSFRASRRRKKEETALDQASV
ncbi:DoxX family protein [Naumannella halotolerans]|uniref:Putative oxidoreductase n=1 Tax=Naumannella halotolerans TaxID=993414 RepID=A0A4V3EMF3_9ACTN|nr:DoxX family protein [Naumannella halotolerans]TDT29908.1 putative oxidoreductase [Naumannella halotolerans]